MGLGEIKLELRALPDGTYAVFKAGEKSFLRNFQTTNEARAWVQEYAEKMGASKVNEVFQTDFFRNKNVVVTGAFPGKLRPDVEAELRDLGANVQKAVNGLTDYLVCGDRVGARKTQAAESLGVKMLNRSDYDSLRTATLEAPVVVKPKLTHAEYIASIPENYGGW